MPEISEFLVEAQSLYDYTRAHRRDFHKHPELGFQEYRTAGIVADELKTLGIEVSAGVGGTGVTGIIEGKSSGPVVLLRFDMDALPIQEESSVEYASQTPGVMHACGHDGHTAIGLTVAKLLQRYRHEFDGIIKLVFQPAEEGLGGALRMVQDGVLDHPRPDYALSLHLWNLEPAGWLGITPGPIMAASDRFLIQISGKGGHGALPHTTVDPVVAAAHIITALQSIVSRNVSPLESAVISVTAVSSGEAFNVIPPVAEIKGTIRSYSPKVRDLVLERLHSVVSGVGQALGCETTIDLKEITLAVNNHPEITSGVANVAAQMFPNAPLDRNYRTMGSEDMAYMMQDIPGCYFLVGAQNERVIGAPHHHPKFDFEESTMPHAAALISAAAIYLLNRKK